MYTYEKKNIYTMSAIIIPPKKYNIKNTNVYLEWFHSFKKRGTIQKSYTVLPQNKLSNFDHSID